LLLSLLEISTDIKKYSLQNYVNFSKQINVDCIRLDKNVGSGNIISVIFHLLSTTYRQSIVCYAKL